MERIVVGYDGSPLAQVALQWAAQEAARAGVAVRVIQSWNDPFVIGPSLTDGWLDPGAAARDVRTELRDVAAGLAETYPAVGFSYEVVDDAATAALVDASQSASMVVVGSRGRGGFSSLLLGSVSQRVAATAASSVVVVRGSERPEGGVVVGVDGSASSRIALRWAADAARRRRCRLRVVMAWSYLLPQGEHGAEPYRAGYSEAEARKVLGSIVDDELGTEPDVDVDQQAVYDRPTRALVEHSEGAALLVLGPRDSSKRPGLDLGSVTLQALHHAPCPIVVARAPQHANGGEQPHGDTLAAPPGSA